ncbi:GNAT family N-acetyltransferase [Actinomadura barringtoniae]|uniref:GNAT family N-acetyltransferase n=1 Tax=Actinomadura barringtoniae TaxID=1427535 RepID=A0A939PI55_9ACTN|nr:GNAT family N-acetyltransferase [Actinomadura barringtoniae]MBO2453146.1 GNAT family N-acetyltransferase [Actinomadura barringtoniae]
MTETVEVTRIEPGREGLDGPTVQAWHAVVTAALNEDLPGTVPDAFDRFSARLAAGATVVWTAVRTGQVAGLAILRRPSAASTGSAQVHVHPAHRRHGVGDRLLNALIAEAHTCGPHGVTLAVPVDGPGDAFCLRRGLTHLRTLHQQLLPLRDLHPGWLDEMVAAEHPGYRLTERTRLASPGHHGAVPGDVLLTVTAEHANGTAAHTEVVIADGLGPYATQHDHPPANEHHAPGLELWVKAAMLRLLYDQHPQVTHVTTDSPEHDAALLAVNSHLGFQRHHRTNEYRLGPTPNIA